MAASQLAVLMLTLILILYPNDVNAQVLTPPYFNLAVGRRIEASATCGLGVSERELFCKLTGANPDKYGGVRTYEVIQGQLCDFCDEDDVTKYHPAEYAIDGTERWWQSPPLSRGLELNRINLTVNLGQEFHVAYVFLRMANSPRPGVFALERSTDNGVTWKPWQYFADTMSDCNDFFGAGNYEREITSDDTVLCTTEYSKVVPLEGGEIVISLVNNRPSANNFSYSATLQEWTKATNVRLRLLRTKTLLGHLMAVARQDPTVTRRYYYSIKDISIGGRCVCYGHANVCDKTNPLDPFRQLCRCQHNTCGDQCEMCCPNYIQKPWRPATLYSTNECEPCQCYEHSMDCVYNEEVASNRTSIDIHGNYEGGGVCQNCQHNTMGINCELCLSGYYRPLGVPLNSTEACQPCRCDPLFSTGDCEQDTGRCVCRPQFTGPNCEECSAGYYGWPTCLLCDCNVNGTRDQICEAGGGQCPCKSNYAGTNCDQCAFAYYGFPDCQPCDCDPVGSGSSHCESTTGECSCRNNFVGRDCSSCARGFYDYPSCELCECDPIGSTDEICDQDTGMCKCWDNHEGERCELCAAGYFNHPECIECGCAEPGSTSTECDSNGQCSCAINYSGVLCDSCAPGYYKYPECLSCECEAHGSYGLTCDQDFGQCNCRYTFEGRTCDRCKANFYNYPICEECSCNPAGAKEVPGFPLGGCGAHDDGRLCECKDRVVGRICDTCQAGFWMLSADNPDGCQGCECDARGTVGDSPVCNPVTGQCFCKPFATDRQCNQCKDGTYNLVTNNPFGCTDCDCDMGGSVSPVCDKVTGQCDCRPRVNGRRCESPIPTHYFPTLYHHKYELEDGYNIEGGPVRYGFDSDLFENFSWRGYAIFSSLQDEVLVDIDINKPSLYRVIFRYVNPSTTPVRADISLVPEVSSDEQQAGEVVFQPTTSPQFVTVSRVGVATSFVLNPGTWSISLKTPAELYVDYVVLLPQDYYEGGILQQAVNKPCELPATDELCQHYVYVNLSVFSISQGSSGYIINGTERQRTQLFPDIEISRELESLNMAHLTPEQQSMYLTVPVPQPGPYIFVMVYHSRHSNTLQSVNIDVASTGSSDSAYLNLPDCPYSALCRQAVTNSEGNIQQFYINGSYAYLTITGGNDINLAIDSVVAIPVMSWNIELLDPKLQCIKQDQMCVEAETSFFSPTGSIRTEVEAEGNEDLVSEVVPPSIVGTGVKVIKVDRQQPVVTIRVSVSSPGRYILVGHYYQPYSSSFDVDVTVNVDGSETEGTMRVDFCPSIYGCRSVLKFPGEEDMQVLDLTSLDFNVTFNSTTGQAFWLDYLVTVPVIQYSTEVLNVQGVDKSSQFLTLCGQDNFHITPSSTDFCREAVYSLTTSYNNGAAECNCNTDGSVSFTCDDYGGQCRCKDHVIGRTCAQCTSGYYGFPDCLPCDCPTGLCDSDTGQCVCPSRVTGQDCDTCVGRTYGFDRFIGCQDCNCDAQGVDDILDCHLETGQCLCRPNIGGRRCDQCLPGFYSFPSCLPCSCDTKGTMEQICDKNSAECVCKENVQSEQCTECRPSTFYLEERNPYGCTSCFCFNIATTCQSSFYFRDQVEEKAGWAVTNILDPFISQNAVFTEMRVSPDNIFNQNLPIYWIAPLAYTGNKVTSYGGTLTYTVRFRLPRTGEDYHSLVAPDVRIEGNNFTIVHQSYEQPEAGVPWTVSLDMLESNFVHESTGSMVSREQLMMALQNIEVLHIRASYYSSVTQVRLYNVTLDTASPDGLGDQALNVESCDCPPNYQGSSCEMCAPGYYRSHTGPYLGVCVPCQCNGRADVCNPETGECQDCRDNFSGPQCLTCQRAHYYDARSGVCEMCPCPYANTNTSFADTCSVSGDGRRILCACHEGYHGNQCQACNYGYWGSPHVLGGSCQLCECNDNIDITDRSSCDVDTGACVKCINHTTGSQCERCQDWYFGDALFEKNCQVCDCDMQGSERCDYRTGSCLCRPFVAGPRCDICVPETYGFNNEESCQPCDCAEGAYSNQCNVTSGLCDCQPGVRGRQCGYCERGYWNFGPLGCTKCECEFEGAVTCDQYTGECQCLPGVTGPMCDQCLPRWAMIPDEGCFECDNCIDLLLDDMALVERNVTLMMDELVSVSVGQNAIRRLQLINDTVAELRPQVDGLITDPTDPSLLDPLKQELYIVQRRSTEVRNKADRVLREAQLILDDAAYSVTAANELEEMIVQAVDAGESAVVFAQDVLQDILSNIEEKNVDTLLQQAEEVLQTILSRNFSSAQTHTEEELALALDALAAVSALYRSSEEQANRTRQVAGDLSGVQAKLEDLKNNSRHSLDNSRAALDLNKDSNTNLEETEGIMSQISADQSYVQGCIDDSQSLLSEASDFLNDANNTFQGLEAQLSRLDVAMEELRTFVDDLDSQNVLLAPLVSNATQHAQQLQDQAGLLESLIADTRDSAEGALNASNAYQAIVDTINSALNASQDAIVSAGQALDMSNGLADSASDSRSRSELLDTDSSDTAYKVNEELPSKLESGVEKTTMLSSLNNRTKDVLTDMLLGLNMLPEGGYSVQAEEATQAAMRAENDSVAAVESVNDILDALPQDRATVEQIPLLMDQAKVNTIRAQTAVENVLGLVPDATLLLDALDAKASQVRQVRNVLAGNIDALRQQIQLARDQSSLINVGMTFNENSTLMLSNPQSLSDSGSHSEFSLFVKTRAQDGFITYIGPDRRTEQQIDDYMSLMMEDGHLVFRYDLGDGPGVLRNPKNISDGKWHKVVASRTGKLGMLTVRTADEDDVLVEGMSPGTYSVFDINPAATRFYMGGVPETAGLDSLLGITHFVGAIEEVNYGGIQVGLWNFVQGQGTTGCVARSVLKETEINGFLFDGDGYVILDQGRFQPQTQANVKFSFKTFAAEGLILLMGDSTTMDFFSVEMIGGKVVFQFDLGSNPARLVTVQDYNDGAWHEVQVIREGKNGLIQVDQEMRPGRSPGRNLELDITGGIYIGGYKGEHPFGFVTQTAFKGCIKDVTLGTVQRRIYDNEEAKGVSPGCPEMARVVSFSQLVSDAYVALPTVDIGLDFQLTMKVKTTESEGLLFFTSDQSDTQSNALSVAMVDGKFKILAVRDDVRDELVTGSTLYDDGLWHYLTVTKEGRTLQMDIDDQEMVSSRFEGRRRITTTSALYFGGLPADLTVLADNVATQESFIGCIGDVTVNGAFQNFAKIDPSDVVSASLEGCPLPDLALITENTVVPAPVSATDPPHLRRTGEEVAQCALPQQPPTPSTVDASLGIRYGGHPESRTEYIVPTDIRSRSDFSLEFKTTSSDGVIFYVADERHLDFVGLYLKNGQVNYRFDCGSGPAVLVSDRTYNNGQWHKVIFSRDRNEGQLVIDDGDETKRDNSPGNSTTMDIQSTYYVGGLSALTYMSAARNLDDVSSGYVGCLRSVQVNGEDLTEVNVDAHTDTCLPDVEPGTFFTMEGGHLTLYDEFQVGLDLDISVEVRPRSVSGVLLSVMSRVGDYMVLQMVNGQVIFNVDNGAGEIVTRYSLSSPNQLCDGEWHTIKAVKSKNVVTLTVDNMATVPGIGSQDGIVTMTNDPLYIGGIPASHAGIKTSASYVGCVRDLRLKSVIQNLSAARVTGGVRLNTCPTV